MCITKRLRGLFVNVKDEEACNGSRMTDAILFCLGNQCFFDPKGTKATQPQSLVIFWITSKITRSFATKAKLAIFHHKRHCKDKRITTAEKNAASQETIAAKTFAAQTNGRQWTEIITVRYLDGHNRQSPIASVQLTQSTLASHSAIPRGTNVAAARRRQGLWVPISVIRRPPTFSGACGVRVLRGDMTATERWWFESRQ